MAERTVSVEEFDNVLALILDEYAREVSENLEKDIRAVAKQCKEELRETSPQSGRNVEHYADGWSYRLKSDHYGHISAVVKNNAKPGLTHLLEKGHVARNGKPVAGTPHIKPAAEHAAEELSRRLK